MASLINLPAKLRIYDALILSKEMRNFLVKLLLDQKICLDKLDDTSLVEDETTADMEEAQLITFHDLYLLLRSII